MRLNFERSASDRLEKEVFLRKLGKTLDSDPYVDNGDKMVLLLVASGLKPGGLINLMWPSLFEQFAVLEGKLDQSKLSRSGFDREVRSLRKLIRDSGVSHGPIKVAERTDEYGVRIAEVSLEIASNDEILKDLSAAVRHENHRRIGILLGFPKTAVDFFVDVPAQERIKISQPAEFELSPAKDLFQFVPSPQHWRDELKVLERWEKIVKKFCPKIYESRTDIKPSLLRLRSKDKETLKRLLSSPERRAALRKRSPHFFDMFMQEEETISALGDA